jgi:lysozyme
MDRKRLMAQLGVDEGRRNKLYKDTATPPKWTVGVGRNIEDRGLRDDEIDLMLSNDIDEAVGIARTLFPQFDKLDDVRQEVLVNMAFNMGGPRLAGFKKFLAALSTGNYQQAAAEMIDSTWYRQVGARAQRLACAMQTGAFK